VSFTAVREVSLQLDRLSQNNVTAQRHYVKAFRTKCYPNQSINMDSRGKNSITRPSKVWRTLSWFSWNVSFLDNFFKKDSNLKFHGNPRKDLDAETISQKDGRTNVVLIQAFVLLRQERLQLKIHYSEPEQCHFLHRALFCNIHLHSVVLWATLQYCLSACTPRSLQLHDHQLKDTSSGVSR
jgi:hypothetical protein